MTGTGYVQRRVHERESSKQAALEAARVEHSLLRQEIIKYNDEVFKTEIAAFAAAAALYAWLIAIDRSGYSTEFIAFVCLLPVLLIGLAFSRLISYKNRSARIGIYVALLEERMGSSYGWEHFVWGLRFQFNPFDPTNRKTLADIANKTCGRCNFGMSVGKVDLPQTNASLRDATPPDLEKIIRFYSHKRVVTAFERQFGVFWKRIWWTWFALLTLSMAISAAIFEDKTNFFRNLIY